MSEPTGTEEAPPSVKLCECGCGRPAPIAKTYDKRTGRVKGQPMRFLRNHGFKPGYAPRLFVEAGQRIGHSVVVDPEVRIQFRTSSQRGARLRCDCGTEFTRMIAQLLRIKNLSCSKCSRRRISGPRSDLTGERFGKLVVVRHAPESAHVKNRTAWWLCRCDCGNELAVIGCRLRDGHTRSCGCLRLAAGKGYGPGDAAMSRVLRSYQANAQARDLPWELTRADFKRLASLDCFYCGGPPSKAGKASPRSGEWVYNGIDRVDNALGYTLENVVPCCEICNHAKKDLTFDDFMAWIARLTEYHWFHPEVMPSRLLASQGQYSP